MTKLDAVNYVLMRTGGLPVPALDTGGNSAHAMAERIIDQETISVLHERWHFNVHSDVTVELDGNDNLPIPEGTLQIDTDAEDASTDAAQLGNRLYDKGENTFEFDADTKTEQVKNYDWGCIPDYVHRYIAAKAALQFDISYAGGQRKTQLGRDEYRLRIIARKADSRAADYNILSGAVADRIMGGRGNAAARDSIHG